MKSNTIVTIILILILIGAVVFFFPKKSGGNLASPTGNFLQVQPSPTPVTPSYNPPKEIEYDKSTDLNQELDQVDPKVLNSDFDPLKNL